MEEDVGMGMKEMNALIQWWHDHDYRKWSWLIVSIYMGEKKDYMYIYIYMEFILTYFLYIYIYGYFTGIHSLSI